MNAGAGRRWLWVVGAIAAGGCAFGDVSLRAPKVGPVAPGVARGNGREIVLIRPFTDRRDQARCGMKKNGYNSDTASVHCAFAPDHLLADMLAAQLSAAGFVVLSDRTQAKPSTLIITGALHQMFIEPKLNYFTALMEADVALVLHASTPAGFTARRRFYVKGEEATVFAGEEDMQAALASGVRQLLVSVVGAVANLADSVPPEPQPVKPPPETTAARQPEQEAP
jgi:hypothetical protein